jgi:hypothetical protein
MLQHRISGLPVEGIRDWRLHATIIEVEMTESDPLPTESDAPPAPRPHGKDRLR